MNENDNGQEKPPVERIRFSSVISFLFLSVVAIIIAYILGVMTGRSGNEHNMNAEKPLAEGRTEKYAASKKNQNDAILRPQDLDYALVLRNEKARTRHPEPESVGNEPESATSKPETARDKTPQEEETPKKESQSTGEAAQSDPSPPKNEDAPPAEKQEGMFDYVFQLGAFRDEDAVDALRQKLEGRGLRTRMQREGKLYLVMVLLRGNQERADEVLEIAKSLRLGEPIIRSRKAVAP